MKCRTRETYIISDIHLWHKNCIKYSSRPYHIVDGNDKVPENAEAVNQMNEDILKMFDNLPNDCDVWNLGDVFFCGTGKKNLYKKIDTLKEIVKRMKGENRRLFLILGNHDNLHEKDKSRVQFYYDLGFDIVYDTPIILEDKWILSHEPVYIEPGSHFINLYGHTHDFEVNRDYFIYDYENYAQQVREAKAKGLSEPPMEQKYPDKIISKDNYKNMCLDFNKGFIKWSGDQFQIIKYW